MNFEDAISMMSATTPRKRAAQQAGLLTPNAAEQSAEDIVSVDRNQSEERIRSSKRNKTAATKANARVLASASSINGAPNNLPQPPPPNFSNPNPDFVVFTVEPDGVEFRARMDAVKYYSPFFNDRFSLNFEKDYLDKTFNLEYVTETVLRIFNWWLNTQKIACQDDDNKPIPITLLDLGQLWSHGKEWEIPMLQDAAMKCIFRTLLEIKNDDVFEKILQFAYESGVDTKLKKLTIAKLSKLVPSIKNVKRLAAGWKFEILVDLVCEIGRINKVLAENQGEFPALELRPFLMEPPALPELRVTRLAPKRN